MKTPAEEKTEETVSQFARFAADVAMRAAVEVIHSRKLKTADIDLTRLVEALRRHVRAALPTAMQDAREAFAAGMNGPAEITFRLSMSNAGYAAAKEVLG